MLGSQTQDLLQQCLLLLKLSRYLSFNTPIPKHQIDMLSLSVNSPKKLIMQPVPDGLFKMVGTKMMLRQQCRSLSAHLCCLQLARANSNITSRTFCAQRGIPEIVAGGVVALDVVQLVHMHEAACQTQQSSPHLQAH